MKFSQGLGVILGTATLALVQLQAISTLAPVKVDNIAKQITVMIGGLDGKGSGVIVARKGNTYTVLTAHHVIKKPGVYDIITPDGQKYPVERSQRLGKPVERSQPLGELGKLDLALLKFTSSRNYTIAQVANSSAVQEGATVYHAGFPVAPGSRTYLLIPAELSSRGTGEILGYDLFFTGQPKPGVSGGPILDERGLVIGIYGKAEDDLDTEGVQGIPIEKIPNLESIATVVPWANPTLLATLTGHSKGVYSVAFSPDGRTLASGGDYRVIKLWNLQTQQQISTYFDLTEDSLSLVSSVAFSPDGRTLVSRSLDNTFKQSNLQTQQEIVGVNSWVLSTSRTIKLWNLQTQQEFATLTGHSDEDVLTIGPDGRILASGIVAISPDGRTLASGIVAISPDGRTLASGGDDKTIIWNLQTKQEIDTLTGNSRSVNSVAISPDGRTLPSGGDYRVIKLWNLQTQQQIATFTGHSDGVISVAISPDGRTLASGSFDGTIKLWNLQTQREIATLTGHSDGVNSVAFSPDGRALASGGKDGTIKLWQYL
ncbi:trypsin-like peptidase domain-containing protein [Nodularia spumigena]|uniref:trypsin-like peptidase domain-containing protein n=1 Tax=Nodularia spumigena TaxID=70799 RepID=UPI00232CC7B0|nr:trypsin-like peptidase domain-containing protein [Nodularia spumigena]MDB9316657.1 trypsin-like peptidase domain-containing protein [Nodularia spumigena CS-590/01A]MDB9333872.1 trypsin-like peptidase domain-containing protein [Nodularia spumigena CS-590/01]